MGGGGRVLLCTQRDQLDCPPSNCLNHYLPLNKTGAHSTGERFRATMALFFKSLVFEFSTLFYKRTHLKFFCLNHLIKPIVGSQTKTPNKHFEAIPLFLLFLSGCLTQFLL